MRFLHTADWHVGKTIRGRSRADEFRAVLQEMVKVAIGESVDVVLVAGDLYDQRAAGADADALVFDTLLELHGAGISVVAIPGNHDSPARFQAYSKLLARIGTSMVPRVRPPDAGGVVEIAARDGAERAVVACVPFVPERRFGDAADLFDDPSRLIGGYDDRMGAVFRAMAGAFRRDSINILMAHVFIDGARLGGGEREVTVGRNYAVSPAHVPASASYAALGHVHRPQEIPGCPAPARYAGSLLQLDFGERDQTKFVYVIDASPNKPAKVSPIEIQGGRKLVDLAAVAFDDLPRAAAGLEDAYLRVTIATDGPVPGIGDRVRELLPNALDVRLAYERDDAPATVSVRSLEPREQFLAYYKSAHGAEPGDDLLAAFDEVYEAAGS